MKTFQVQATDKLGRVFVSDHSTLQEAKKSAANCRGRYPYGNRVRVVVVETQEVAP